ncbi:hypothetical protein [Gryllotalpicola koreensis]|uniref:Holin n=1 Tax=Gryllotalpicola koreensis TaxID=993086 RepID=A0ABP8A2Z4_9MICO
MSTTNTTQQATQTATDFVASLIRTYVPILAGLILSWLATVHLPIRIEGIPQGVMESALTAVLAGIWYLIVRALETRWPKLGVFLGVPKAPAYTPPTITASLGADGVPTLTVIPPVFTPEQLAGPAVEEAPDAQVTTPGIVEPAEAAPTQTPAA